MQHRDRVKVRVKLVDLGIYVECKEQGLFVGHEGTLNLDAAGNPYFDPDGGWQVHPDRDSTCVLGWPVDAAQLEVME